MANNSDSCSYKVKRSPYTLSPETAIVFYGQGLSWHVLFASTLLPSDICLVHCPCHPGLCSSVMSPEKPSLTTLSKLALLPNTSLIYWTTLFILTWDLYHYLGFVFVPGGHPLPRTLNVAQSRRSRNIYWMNKQIKVWMNRGMQETPSQGENTLQMF